jgi:hypothetical protein
MDLPGLLTLELSPVGRVLLAAFAAYEGIAAVVLLGPLPWMRAVARRAYGLDLGSELDPKYELANRMVGLHSGQLSLVTALGAGAGGAPGAIVAISVAALSLGRALARWKLRALLERAFGVTPERSFRKALFNLALAVIFILAGFRHRIG